MKKEIPLLLFIGYSNSGKTTVITGLIQRLTGHGLRIAYLKRSHCGFQMDREGKDTYLASQAGAEWIAISSENRSAFLCNQPLSPLQMRELAPDADLILIEGFTDEDFQHKIEVVRDQSGGLKSGGKGLIATISEEPVIPELPNFPPLELDKLTEFIIDKLSLTNPNNSGIINKQSLSC